MRQLACTSKLGLDEERLLTDDVRSAPLFMTALENFRLRSWAWNTPARSMIMQWIPHYSRDLPCRDRSCIAQVTDDIEKGWEDVHSVLDKVSNSNSATLKTGLRFSFVSGGREGVGNETYVLRFASFCELLRRPLSCSFCAEFCCLFYFFACTTCILLLVHFLLILIATFCVFCLVAAVVFFFFFYFLVGALFCCFHGVLVVLLTSEWPFPVLFALFLSQ